MDEQGSPQDHLTPAPRTPRWWAGLAGAVAVVITAVVLIAVAVAPDRPGPAAGVQVAAPGPATSVSEPAAPQTYAVEPAPEPEPAAAADFAGWISGSRALLGEQTATDEGMLLIGVTLCAQMPLSEEAATAYAVAGSAGSASMSADEWLAMAALADRTLCPGGRMLSETPGGAVETAAPAVVPCPAVPAMKPRLRLVSTKPSADGGVTAVIDVTLTNPAAHEVWISARLVDRAEGNQELVAPGYGGALWDYRLPGGRTTTTRIEVLAIDGAPRHLDWGHWSVWGAEYVGDDGPCAAVDGGR